MPDDIFFNFLHHLVNSTGIRVSINPLGGAPNIATGGNIGCLQQLGEDMHDGF